MRKIQQKNTIQTDCRIRTWDVLEEQRSTSSKAEGRQTVVAVCTETVNPEEAGSEEADSIGKGSPSLKQLGEPRGSI